MYNTCLCINSTQVHIYVCTLFYWLVHHKKKRRKKKKKMVLTSATIYIEVQKISREITLYLLNYT